MTMPNFLIIGAEKSGTTAVWHYLRQHPQVFMSPVKEPAFFSFEAEEIIERGPGHLPTSHVRNIEAYRALFDRVTTETAVGEASSSYMYVPKACERIKYYVPEVRLIAILRDPVERAYSNFLHCKWLNREPLDDFALALQKEEQRMNNNWGYLWYYREKGCYYSQLRRYFDAFDRGRIKVCLYEDLQSDPASFLQSIFSFLEVDDAVVVDVSMRHNVSGIPRNKSLHTLVAAVNRPFVKDVLPDRFIRRLREPLRNWMLAEPPPLSPEIRRQLTASYREDILKLQDLIDRDLSRWLDI